MEGQSLKLVSDEQLEEEIKSNLSELLSNPEFISEFKMRLISQPSFLRQETADRIMAVLKMNNESISTSLVSKKGMRLPPTVSNWLKDYLGYVGEQEDKNKKEEYFNSNEFRALAEEEKRALKTLFELYGTLLSISKSPESLETVVIKDKSGQLKVFRRGEFIDLAQPSIESKEVIAPAAIKEEIPPVEPRPEETVKQAFVKTEEERKKKPAASFYFSPEDEEEIRGHTDQLSSYVLPATESLDDVVQKVIADNNLGFSDELLRKRFESIARSRLKEIRSEKDTLDLLTRSEKIGGLNYSTEQAESILESLNREIPDLARLKPKEEMPKKPEIPIPTPAEALQKKLAEEKIFKPTPAEPDTAAEEKPAPPPSPVITPPPPTQAQDLYAKAMRQVSQERGRKMEVAEKEPERVKPRMFQRPVPAQKRRVEDIRRKAKMLGPVEELKDLAIDDFRKLGTEKVSSAQKVYEKLNLLKEDTFAKYAAGVKAWRGSEVYQTYLRMGRESMDKGKTIREIIEESQASGQSFLSESEFNAVADLNKKLRF